MSAPGSTKRTRRPRRRTSASGARPEKLCSTRVFRLSKAVPGGEPMSEIWPADAMVTRTSHPDAKSCSATRTAKEPPTADPTTPKRSPSSSHSHISVWKQAQFVERTAARCLRTYWTISPSGSSTQSRGTGTSDRPFCRRASRSIFSTRKTEGRSWSSRKRSGACPPAIGSTSAVRAIGEGRNFAGASASDTGSRAPSAALGFVNTSSSSPIGITSPRRGRKLNMTRTGPDGWPSDLPDHCEPS